MFRVRFFHTDDHNFTPGRRESYESGPFPTIDAAYRYGREWEDEYAWQLTDPSFIVIDEAGNDVQLPSDEDAGYLSEWDRLKAHFDYQEEVQWRDILNQIPYHLR